MTKMQMLMIACFTVAIGCASESNNDYGPESTRTYENDEPDYSDPDDEVDGSGGGGELRLPFPSDEHWNLTRAYNTGSHVDYGYDWVDDRYALDFALSGCDSWRKPITPMRSGVVEVAGSGGGYGNYVIVDHGDGYKSRYAHFDELEVGEGDLVDTEVTIGLTGNSGSVSGVACPDHPGTHLHVVYYLDGEGVLPEPMSGHTDFTTGCWYGHYGWIDCDGDGEDDNGLPSDDPQDDDDDSEDEGDDDDTISDGCDWTVPSEVSTIQGALDVVMSGQVICVEAGSYSEDLVFPGLDITVQSLEGADQTHLYGVATGIYQAAVTFDNSETNAMVFQGFTIHGVAHRVVELTSSSPTLKNLVIDCNTVSRYGLYLDGVTSIQTQNTQVESCETYGVYASGASGELHNLIVVDSGSAGIKADTNSELNIVNAVVYNNGSIGVWMNDADAVLENSIVVGHSMYGVYLEESDHTLMSFYNTFDNNNSTYGDNVEVSWGNNIEDPQFTNAAGGDFTLSSLSPSIDDGDPASSHNDADGTRNDKGAFGGPYSESW